MTRALAFLGAVVVAYETFQASTSWPVLWLGVALCFFAALRVAEAR